MTEMQTATTPTAPVGLRVARKRAGIGLERCARFSGVSIRDIVRYERGRTVPGITNAARLARVLGIRVNDSPYAGGRV